MEWPCRDRPWARRAAVEGRYHEKGELIDSSEFRMSGNGMVRRRERPAD